MQAGVTRKQLNAKLHGTGLHFPIDPGADASLGGTCTGEHGIGLHKQRFLVDETGEGAVAAMRRIKRALDPNDILNPGKIFAPVG